MPTETAGTHDLVVIGGGPAGYAAALYGASAGLSVALVEKDLVGGTCLHRGCIPAKALLEAASVRRSVAHAPDLGIVVGSPSLDFGITQDRKQGIVDQLAKGLGGLLKGRKVDVFDGIGSLGADGVVSVRGGTGDTAELRGNAVLLATGSLPRTIEGFEVDGRLVVTSDELLELRTLPARTAVIGGGAIGCEFASMLADLGSSVTLLEAMPKILPGCDDDIAKVVLRSFKKRGIEVRTGVPVHGHEPGDNGTTVTFGDGEQVEVDLIVVSVGRRPLTDGLGLEATEVRVDERGYIEVDELCRTTQEGVWAAGDVIATPQLAHIGFAEGMVVVRDVLGENPVPIDHSRVPWCIYCHPEVAFAGHSESAAREAGFEVVVSKHRFAGNGRAMIVGDTDGMIKVIAKKRADGTAGQILGVHMVGPWVTEQLGQGYMAVNWEATVDEVAAFIQPHPTMSEIFGETAMSLTGRSLHG